MVSWYHDFMKRVSISAEMPLAEQPLQVTVPLVTKRSLKVQAARTGETMRVIVLRALAQAGIEVPKSELQDRRKGA